MEQKRVIISKRLDLDINRRRLGLLRSARS